MNVTKVGSFIRNQRMLARLSLRNVSGLAGVSIPYLSQVERGLRKPSADILQSIAKALRISAETLYVEAGILEERDAPDVVAAVLADRTITERHQQALIEIYRAFRQEAAAGGAEPATADRRRPNRGPKAASPTKPGAATRISNRTKTSVTTRTSDRTKARASSRGSARTNSSTRGREV